MALAPGPQDAAVRPATAADVDAMDELCRGIYRISRRGEIEFAMQLGTPIFVFDAGHVSGYLVAGITGHGVAETEDGMLALLSGAATAVGGTQSLLPIRNASLYRRAIAAGHKNVKVMNLMALGPYDPPVGVWAPSVMF